MALEKELVVFTKALPELLDDSNNQGQFALVHDSEIAGIYPTFDQALTVGYDRFQLAPFLVREITDQEQPRYFSRNLSCQS